MNARCLARLCGRDKSFSFYKLHLATWWKDVLTRLHAMLFPSRRRNSSIAPSRTLSDWGENAVIYALLGSASYWFHNAGLRKPTKRVLKSTTVERADREERRRRRSHFEDRSQRKTHREAHQRWATWCAAEIQCHFNTQAQEASTHKCAKTNAGNAFVTRDLWSFDAF